MGVESAYVSALKQNVFALSGPTIFEPILEKSKRIARYAHGLTMQDKDNNKIQYFILLILTDGIITDMKQTKNQIVEIANEFLPLSIVIVGIGNADFAAMDELDGDDQGLMNSKGQYSKRDIVQFVPYNKYQGNLTGLSKETLAEIPKQFLSYVRHHNIKPGKRVPPKVEVINTQFAMTDEDAKDPDDEGSVLMPRATEDYNANNGGYWETVPLPPGWERAYDETGKAYYVDNVNHSTQWEHPSASQQK